jgi:hypothetical protein
MVLDDAVLDDAAPVRPPPRAGFSIRAAMIVPGLGLLILIVFIAAGILTSNPVQPAKTSTGSFTIPGTSLRALPAVADLKVIAVAGQPPGNILAAISVPRGAKRVSFANHTQAAQQYDAQITLKADESQAILETFYKRDLRKQGWQIVNTGPADHDPSAFEVLGKKAGSDGFYWEMGAVISATSFGSGAPAGGTTSFSLELIQEPDPD